MSTKRSKPLSVEENLGFCPDTHHYYSTTAFPRICNTCEKVYLDREQFIKDTTALVKGNYSKGTRGKVFEYRNCSCGSTLVCAIESTRDNSPLGLEIRKEFERKVKFLSDNGIDKKRAREIVLAKVRSQQAENDCFEDEVQSV